MTEMPTIKTFDPVLDRLMGGGLPTQTLNILAGGPGTGKSVFIQQWLFSLLKSRPDATVLYLTTLSEPPAKTVRYMRMFPFFDQEIFRTRFMLEDMGIVGTEDSIPEIRDWILTRVGEMNPDFLVIDSFKAIRDLAGSVDAYRRFVYQTANRLFSRQCTTFLIGEYSEPEILEGSEFAVADGIITFGSRLSSGEDQRVLEIRKLRGGASKRVPVPFRITGEGVQIEYIETDSVTPVSQSERLPTGIPGLDHLVRGGFPVGDTVLLSGLSGTGKTTLALQTTYHALQEGMRVLYYSVESSPAELVSTASRFGWDFSRAIADGSFSIRYVSQSSIQVERDLLAILKDAERLKPAWIVVDSFSVFLYRMSDAALYREKVHQIRHIISSVGAVGLLLTDLPSDASQQTSRMGVEETVVDGVVSLKNTLEQGRRYRYIEVLKLRQTDHNREEQRMEITDQGIKVFYGPVPSRDDGDGSGAPLRGSPVDTLIKDNLRYDSTWLVRGEPGAGKTVFAMQFAAAGLQNEESVLLITADAPLADTERRLRLLGVDVQALRSAHRLEILDSYGGVDSRLDPSDFRAFNYIIEDYIERMAPPIRIVFDSITPLAARFESMAFVGLIHRKNRLLRRPAVCVLDTHTLPAREERGDTILMNGYDIVIDLATPGDSYEPSRRSLRIRKARDVAVSGAFHSYGIDPARGIEFDVQVS